MTRPRLHLTTATGWLNDPLGLTYRDGVYHVFFQHVPDASAWTVGCHWGHATSPDLLRWTEQPVALAPGDGDDGCWSGCVTVPADGDAVMFYTSVRHGDSDLGRVRRARPADAGWQEWIKEDTVVVAPSGFDLTAFRDPFVFPDGDTWRMLVGAGTADGAATAFGYESADLVDWTFAGELTRRGRGEATPVWTGAGWECVQLVPLRGRHVLVVSVWDRDRTYHVAAAVGTYSHGHFDAGNWYQLTYGPTPYAASAYTDRDGHAGLIAWLRGIAGSDGTWAGALSIPTRLALDGSGRPWLTPHPVTVARRTDMSGGWPAGAPVDIDWSPTAGSAGSLRVFTGDGATVADLVAAGATLTLSVPGDEPLEVDMPWDGDDVRLLLDGPVLEVFCGGAMMAAPVDPHHQRVRHSGGGARCWRLATD
jgi:beta-fructofuranosidase